MPSPAPTPVRSLYVHVPFCAQKCSYCAFYSALAHGEQVNRYVAALIRELEILAPELQPTTIFFGGGTPSLLNLRQWETLFAALARLNLLGAAEFTVECNPATVSRDKAQLLRDHGVNRISMGVQSLDEALLDRLGRVHSREMVFKSYDLLRAAGFTNVNLDLMFAIPGQSLTVWQQTLREAVALGSEHLSSYEVIYEEDTALYAQLRAKEFDVDEDLACAMYEALVERAAAAGYQQYEVANFARDQRATGGGADSTDAAGKSAHRQPPAGGQVDSSPPGIPRLACQHNLNYWRGGDFYGAGPSATSYVRGERTKNWSNTDLYCEQLERGRRAIESREALGALARAGETAAFGLRLLAGWRFSEFRATTGHELPGEWSGAMDTLVKRGWAAQDAGGFRLTAGGLRFADAAAELFLR
jgi:oxygen-independent coproporphyrinogen-3 oxidase